MTIYAQAWPGGAWTSAYTGDSVGSVAYSMSVIQRWGLPLLLLLILLAVGFMFFGLVFGLVVSIGGVLWWGWRRSRRRGRKKKKGK